MTHWVTSRAIHTVAETSIFQRRAAKLLTSEEHDDLISFLANNPEAGDVIAGGGGVRKVRWAGRGKGKRGGVRVIYYLLDESLPIYALLIYGKDEKDDLSAEELKVVRSLAGNIKATRKRTGD